MITLIGLGVEKHDVTLRALEAMRKADKVLVRTSRLPSAEGLKEEGIAFESLDFLYEKSRNFTTLAKNIADEVKKRAEGVNLCYCVDGGVSEDRAARILLKRKDVEVIEGVSKAAYVAAKAGFCGGYSSVSAYEIAESKLSLPLVVYDIDNRLTAGDVKLVLTEKFGDETKAYFFDGGKKKPIALYETDRQTAYGEHTAVAVEAVPLLRKTRFDFEDFVAILKRLRAPDGCPWDRVQTHESIRINAIEEAYELVDAIDCNDPDKMCEEAGDVLMQALFHTLIEEEKGGFSVTDMLSGVCEKLITRHTHVFGTDKAAGADGALSVWEKNKMTEKHQTTFSDSVNDVPACFPALLRAQKVAKRMAKGGLEVASSFEEAEQNLNSEVEKLKAVAMEGNEGEIAKKLGDVLMAAVLMGRAVGGDCEQSLLDAVKKAQAHYTAFESLVLSDGKNVNALTREEREFYEKKANDAARD